MAKPIIDQLLGQFSDSLTAKEAQNRFSHIWKTDQPLVCSGVCFPRSTEDVAAIMKWCYAHNQEVVVHGGLTNLVGGTQTTKDQLVISLEKMNKIDPVDTQNRTVCVQAGAILETVLDLCEEENLFLPLSFGARGSAQVGGVVSTNAGGLRVFRYGMTRSWVLGIEIVLPNGTVIENLKLLRKDNSGIDLKQLFIGSEGILGIVTRVVFRLIEKPKTRNSAMLTTDSYEDLLKTLRHFDQSLGDRLTGFELLWQSSFNIITAADTPYTAPLKTVGKYVIFVEMLGQHAENDIVDLQDACALVFEQGWLHDAAFFDSYTAQQECWKIREDVALLETKAKYNQHFDISIPIDHIGAMIEYIVAELLQFNGVIGVYPFGHVADGNIHLIVGKDSDDKDLTHKINVLVYEQIQKVNGSISAEHGIGIDKKPYLHLSRDPYEIELMRGLKQLFDHKNILNPNRIIN